MDLYKIISIETKEDSSVVNVKIDPEHDVFKGHFPEFPIMPGVLQVEMVKDLFGQILSTKLRLISAKSIKYLGMIDPNMYSELTVDLSYKNEEEKWKLKANIYSTTSESPIVFMKFSGLFSQI